MTILIVDDSATMRMLLRRDLRVAGWEDVEEAPDAASALRVLSTSDVSLVLSDWHMPSMTGLDLLERVRNESNETRFGFVTCEASDKERVQALRAGAQFLITKPVDHEDLSHHIRLALGMDIEGYSGRTGAEERTLQDVLTRLFQRPVSVAPAPPPRRELVRTVAEYKTDRSEVETACAVIEMPLAAAFGCALGRIPGKGATEWASAHNLTDSVEKNFMEVANVLAAFVSAASGHYVLHGVDYVGEGGLVDREKEKKGWEDCVQIDIAGYPAGRLGIIR